MEVRHLASRNETLGFAERTKKNFLFIEAAYHHGADVHLVTQLITSLLGIVIFPWERVFQHRAKSTLLDELVANGWPAWAMSGKACGTLEDLIEVLRHSLAHGNVRFSSESRRLADVQVELWNRPKNPILYWHGSISGNDLRTFCLNFLELVDQTVG